MPTPRPQSRAEAPSIASGLSHASYLANPDLLPPAIMTREQAEGPQAHRPSNPGGPALPSAIDGVLDVFQFNSAELDTEHAADRLQAFYWRLKGYQSRRILLTGLLKTGESGGESLSRERVRVISQRMVQEGGFQGEFILKVDPTPGPRKGVRVEVLRR
ncbi:MAG TPA: hypothetical protein VK842_10145 [bacterium]|nr:hypothetical protein [bacterium]